MLVAVAATMALGACATNDVGKSSGRLAISRALEAGAGSADTRVGLVLGPPAGLPPGEVADYMDRQEADLRAETEGTGVAVARVGEQIHLTLPANVTFRQGSADLRSDFFDVLNSLSRVMSEYDQTVIEITAHTDRAASESINLPLSQRRADSIAMYLRAQRVDRGRLSSRGMGSRQPIASNDTVAGREHNRRVEIVITPVSSAAPDATGTRMPPEEQLDDGAAGGIDEGVADAAPTPTPGETEAEP